MKHRHRQYWDENGIRSNLIYMMATLHRLNLRNNNIISYKESYNSKLWLDSYETNGEGK